MYSIFELGLLSGYKVLTGSKMNDKSGSSGSPLASDALQSRQTLISCTHPAWWTPKMPQEAYRCP